MQRVLFGLLTIGLPILSLQGAPILQLNPSGGLIAGSPGATIGWGFTLTNSSDYLVVTGSSFTPPSLYGVYQDYIGTYNLLVVGPSPESPVVSQSFSSTFLSGVGAFTINSTAPFGAAVTGDLVVHYSLFSQDPNTPNFDPITSLLVTDASISQPTAVDVVPEPCSLFLLLTAASVTAASKAKKRT